MVDCGKRWEEDPICGSSFPKVVSCGHQQITPSQSQTNTASSSYAQIIKSPKSKYPPKTPPKQLTPSKVRSFSRGWEKFELLMDFKKWLDQQRRSSSEPGHSRSNRSSPNHSTSEIHAILKPPKKGPSLPLPLDSPPQDLHLQSMNKQQQLQHRQSHPSLQLPRNGIDSSGDEVPKQKKKKKKKKEKPHHHTDSNIFQMDDVVLDRLHKVQPQLLKILRVLHNFKEVNGRNVEDPRNFSNAWDTSVIREGRGSEGALKMFGEVNRALGPSASSKTIFILVKALFFTPRFIGQ